MSERVRFYVYNEQTGRVLYTGSCDADQVPLQAHAPGTSVGLGEADPDGAMVNASGEVESPIGPTPHTIRPDLSGLTGLTNPTKITWSRGTFHSTSGRFLAQTADLHTYTLLAPGYDPVDVQLVGALPNIGESLE